MINMNAFKREPENLIQAQLAAVERVIRSGWWVLGKEVQTFEAEWSSWSGCRHTVGVGNGMDALEIGLRSLDIGMGDEVITTPMTAFATVLAILRAGATPVFGDIDPDTGILSIESVSRCISDKTRAVIVVHLYGQAAPLDAFEDLCRSKDLHLIEDCAQAHGAAYNGRKVGTVGVFSGWSFYPTKNLGAVGDGGALSTQSMELAEKARQLRNYGQSVRYYHPHEGLNSRLDELQAAILKERLKYLDQWTTHRKEIAQSYVKSISNPLVRILPSSNDPMRHTYHLFVITSPKRTELIEYLRLKNIESLIHYPIPAHRQEPCNSFKFDPKGLKNAEKHSQECLSIPCHPFLTKDEIEKVIDAINRFN